MEGDRPSIQQVIPGFDPEREQLEGFSGMQHMVRITQGLLDRGYKEDDIHKVLGGNFLRVFEQVWG